MPYIRSKIVAFLISVVVRYRTLDDVEQFLRQEGDKKRKALVTAYRESSGAMTANIGNSVSTSFDFGHLLPQLQAPQTGVFGASFSYSLSEHLEDLLSMPISEQTPEALQRFVAANTTKVPRYQEVSIQLRAITNKAAFAYQQPSTCVVLIIARSHELNTT